MYTTTSICDLQHLFYDSDMLTYFQFAEQFPKLPTMLFNCGASGNLSLAKESDEAALYRFNDNESESISQKEK